MGWKDLLGKGYAEDPWLYVLPWTGGREIADHARRWQVFGALPREHGWYCFMVSHSGRKAELSDPTPANPNLSNLYLTETGYLVGDRLVPDGATVDPQPARIAEQTERVHLVEPGLDRFARVSAGRTHEGGPLIYAQQEMPLGPEWAVVNALIDGKVRSVDHLPGVTPALDAAFRMELFQRDEAERRRREAEAARRLAEEARAREELRQRIIGRLGDGAGRREMAHLDFGEAARAALAVGGAEYLDHRPATRRGEFAVRYRLIGRRFECVCDTNLRIIDAGICLNDYETGTKGDRLFTLESLPGVVRQGDREGRLVVFRHV